MKLLNGIFSYSTYLSMGVIPKSIDLQRDEKSLAIYRKYLGSDYVPGTFYTTVIGNHMSWAEILHIVSCEAPSFMAKDSVKKMPVIGSIMVGSQGMFIDRHNKDARLETIRLIENRQQEMEAGKVVVPVSLYPEGTASMGKYINKFKKGAFYGLSPIKPYINLPIDDGSEWNVGTGGMSLLLHLVVTATFIYTKMTCLSLPVIKPTEYMYEKFNHLGKDKPSIYTEVMRHIMSEISGLKLIDSDYEVKLSYISEIKGKKVVKT